MKGSEIMASYERYYESGEKIKPENLARIGVRLTARFISVGRFKLFELLPLKSDQPAEACFLSLRPKDRGVIVPNPFHEHRATISAMCVAKGLNSNTVPKKQVYPHADEGERKKPGSALPESERKAAALDGRRLD